MQQQHCITGGSPRGGDGSASQPLGVGGPLGEIEYRRGEMQTTDEYSRTLAELPQRCPAHVPRRQTTEGK